MIADTETPEQYLLSCLLKHPPLWDELKFIVKKYHFRSAQCIKLFDIFSKWYETTEHKDTDYFLSHLGLEYSIWKNRSKEFLDSIFSKIVSKDQAIEKWEMNYKTLDKVYQNQKVVDIFNGIMTKMESKPLDVAINLQEALSDLNDISLVLQTKESEYNLDNIMENKLININKRLDKNFTSCKFGMPALDEMLGGYFPNTYNIIGGRSSMGKSAFMKSLAKNMVDKYNKKIVVFNLEMTNSDFIDRMASVELKIDSNLFLDPKKLTKEDLKRYIDYTTTFNQRYKDKLFLIDNIFDVKEILQKILYFYNTYQIDGVFIDLIEYVIPDKDNFATDQLKFQYLSNEFFRFRKQIPIFITVLQQMNKQGDTISTDGTSNQKSLRGSEDTYLQSDSTIIVFPYKNENKEIETNSRLVVIDKNRHGKKGAQKLGYIENLTSFYDSTIVQTLI